MGIKSFLLTTTMITGLVAATTLPAGAQERVVNIYNWSDYIDPQILRISKETGINVVYDNYDPTRFWRQSFWPVVAATTSWCRRASFSVARFRQACFEARQGQAAEHQEYVGRNLDPRRDLRSGQRIFRQLYVGHHGHRL